MVRKGVRNTRYKVKRRSRDIDQIYEDLQPENISRRLAEATQPDEDLPAMGQHFCVPCSRHFIDQATLEVHEKSKLHKRRLKALEEEPHNQDDADRAAGLLKDEYQPTNSKRICLAPAQDLLVSQTTYVYAD